MNKVYKKVWNKLRGCFVAVSEALGSQQARGSAVVATAVVGLTSVFSAQTTLAGEYWGQVQWGSGHTTAQGVTDILHGGSSANGHWNVDGTMIVYGYVLLAGKNPSGDNIETVNISSTGSYQLMETGDLNAAGDAGHGFINYGQLTSAAGSRMIFYASNSRIENYGTGTVALNGTLSLEGKIINQATFTMNGGLTIGSNGRVTNTGSFFNNSSMTMGGVWTGTGTLQNNGSVNITGSLTTSNLKGNGSLSVQSGGAINVEQINSETTLTNAGTATVTAGNLTKLTNQSGGVATVGSSLVLSSYSNAGTLNASGVFTSRGNSSNAGQANFSNLVIDGTIANTGTMVVNGNLTFNGNGRLTSSGTLQTNNSQNIFSSLGSYGPGELSFINLNAQMPESIQTKVTEIFKKYVKGTVSQTLIDHATFSNGKVVVSNVNLTANQRDDLTQAFKEKLFLPNSSLRECFL